MFPALLRREIVLLLCAKAAALALIYFVFFAPAAVPQPDGQATRTHLLSSTGNR